MAASIRIRPGDDGRLLVVLPYTPQRVEKIKTVPGRRWHAEQKHWTIPATTGMVERLVSLFAEDEIEVDPALHRDWDTRTCARRSGTRTCATGTLGKFAAH